MNESVTVASGQLKAIVERIENIEVEIQEATDARKEVYAEAKANGFDVKTIKTLVAQRKKSPDEVDEAQAMLDLYRAALEGGQRV